MGGGGFSSSWKYLGAPGFSGDDATNFHEIKIHPLTLEPYAVFEDAPSPAKEARVMRFDGTNWVNVGAVGFSAGQIGHAELAFHPSKLMSLG